MTKEQLEEEIEKTNKVINGRIQFNVPIDQQVKYLQYLEKELHEVNKKTVFIPKLIPVKNERLGKNQRRQGNLYYVNKTINGQRLYIPCHKEDLAKIAEDVNSTLVPLSKALAESSNHKFGERVNRDVFLRRFVGNIVKHFGEWASKD